MNKHGDYVMYNEMKYYIFPLHPIKLTIQQQQQQQIHTQCLKVMTCSRMAMAKIAMCKYKCCHIAGKQMT